MKQANRIPDIVDRVNGQQFIVDFDTIGKESHILKLAYINRRLAFLV